MKKVIAVIGATGSQGGSVCKTMLSEPSWHVRALTRDTNSSKSQALAKQGAELVQADLSDAESLTKAFEGVHAIYSVTDSWALSRPERASKLKPGQTLVEYAFEEELNQGRNVFDAAATVTTLERIVFSSLPNVRKLSKGKYSKAYHFDSKALALDYAKEHHLSVWQKTSVLQMGFYLTNFFRHPWMIPKKNPKTGLYEFHYPVDLKMPFVDPENDPGSLTLALLASSTVHNLAACRQWMTMREFIELWSKVHNSKATIKTGPMTTAPPEFLEEINDIVDFQVEYGYYGHAVDDTLVDPPSLHPPVALGTVEEWIRAQDWSNVVKD